MPSANEREGFRDPDEFQDLVDVTGGTVRDTPPGRADVQHGEPLRRKPKRAPKPKQPAPVKPRELPADEKFAAVFAAKVIYFGKHKGLTWGDVPVDYLRWFAELPNCKLANGWALQADVRRFLAARYGLRQRELLFAG